MPDDDPVQRARLAQIALNEAAFRRINEEVYGPHKAGSHLPAFRIVCECGADTCETTLLVTATLYSAVRADPHRFLVQDGHETVEAEIVVERHGEIAVVEKHVGEARQIAEATDPRSATPPT